MRIGLLFTVYNCEKYLKEVLDAWFSAKDDLDIVIAANSGMFSDYHKLGIPYRNKETLEILSEYEIDFLITTKGNNLLGEDESRNLCLNYLKKQQCDLIWVVDGDEKYTKEQILNIINCINNTPDYESYQVNFKNLTIQENLFLDYTHTRIFRTDRHNGIDSFYFDNQFVYNDGTLSESSKIFEIPKSVAHIVHYTWLSDDSRTKDKILYQRLRYCGPDGQLPVEHRCTYEWNDEKDKLQFSQEFHIGRGLEIPCLHEELSKFSNEFTLNYTRDDCSFKVTKVLSEQNLMFEIYDGDTNNLIYRTFMNLSPGVNYYIAPNFIPPDNFYNFLIKVLSFENLVHEEKIHLKLK
jgi:hypothetical protein